MKKFLVILLAGILVCLALVESAQARDCRNRDQQIAGAIIGGVIGGVIGHQFGGGRGQDVATVAGAIGGAIVGGELGCEMGNDEYREIYRVRQQHFHNGYNSAYGWSTSRFRGDVTYTRGGYMMYERRRIVCREYQSVVYFNGRSERTVGTVCRFPDGSVRDVHSTQVYFEPINTVVPAPYYPQPQPQYSSPYPQSPYGGQYGQYGKIISEYEFQQFIRVVAQTSWDENKLGAVESMARMHSSQGKMMTLPQAAIILRQFNWDENKLRALAALKPILTRDGEGIDQVLAVFSWSENKQQALRIITSY